MHKYSLLFYVLLLLNVFELLGQAKVPLEESLAFHQSRRDALRQKLPPNSVAVIFANPLEIVQMMWIMSIIKILIFSI